MKMFFMLIIILLALTGCTSSIGVMATSKEGEYVSVARNMAGPFSSLELAQQEAIDKAVEHCKKMGLAYKKLYAIDRPMAVAQAPESSLYFTCISVDTNGHAQEPSDTSTSATLGQSNGKLTQSPKQNDIPPVLDSYTLEMQALISALEKRGLLKKEEVTEELRKLKSR